MRPYFKLTPGSQPRAEPPAIELSQTLSSLLADRHANAHTVVDRSATGAAANDDDVIDMRGMVRMLRIGRNKLYEMVARNEIPHRRFGRRIRFSRVAVMRWLDSWSRQSAKEGQ